MDGKPQNERSEKGPNKENVEGMLVHMPIPVLLIDNAGKLVAFNEPASKSFGIPIEEAPGMRLRDVTNGVLGKPGDIMIEALKGGRVPQEDTLVFIDANGSNLTFTVTAKPVFDEGGKSTGGVIFFRPSGADKKAEERLYLYEQILDALPWPLSVTDSNMNWTFINKPVEDMLHVKRQDVLGKPCSNWNANICKTKNCGIECLKANRPQTFFEQQNMNFQVDVAYIKDASGNRIGHIEIVQDVTPQARDLAYRKEWVSQHKANLNSLANGDLSFQPALMEADKYTQEVHDQYAAIDMSLVEARDAIKGLVVDSEMLSKAAVEGRLAARADASKHKGDYRKIVQGVDDTLDAVIGPLNLAAKYVDDISKGNIPSKITDNYNGDFNAIKNNLNQCIDEINNLQNDIGSMTRAQSAGDFEVRCKPETHQGAYASLARGVNDAMAAVINPVVEGIGLMDQYAQGDLSKEMRVLPGKQIVMTKSWNDMRSNCAGTCG